MRLVTVCCVLAILAGASAMKVAAEDKEAFALFGAWAQKYKKTYNGNEATQHAFANFKASMIRVAERQAGVDPAVLKFGLTKFADLSPEQFEATYLRGLKLTPQSVSGAQIAPAPRVVAKELPRDLDWRDKGAVSYVKDQGQCGSCWAFSVVEQLESAWFLAGHSLVQFSPQQLLDCDGYDSGCDGGDPQTAYKYFIEAGGVNTDQQYPYEESKGKCRFDDKHIAAKVLNFTYAVPPCNDSCTHQDEEALRAQLATLGPLSICVQATQAWQDYHSGTLYGSCGSDFADLNHAVQLVGWTWWDSAKKEGHWLVRNSWGSDWGEDGYIQLTAFKNLCGLADLVLAGSVPHW